MIDLYNRLHQELLKSDCDVVLALRTAHSIAKRERLTEFDTWIQNELNGYKCTINELPDYRKIKGSIKAFNTYYGTWVPYVVEDEKMEELLSTATLFDSISAIIQLCKDNSNGTLTFRYRGDTHKKLEDWVDFPQGLDIQLHVNTANIYAVIDNVKNRLLEWVIENNMDREEDVLQTNTKQIQERDYGKVFIVHGHNGELREAVARLLERQDISPIVLFEQPNQGLTIIEKFEKNSDVGAAICLFTADDMAKAKNDDKMNPRARQNVVFESGFFIGKLGRENVIFIADNGIELPSDLQGVVYTDARNWKFDVLKELKAIGYSIDYNKLD